MRGLILSAVLIAGLLGLAAVWRGGLPPLARGHDLEGAFAPAYDPGGAYLYFVWRSTQGVSRGPGWEFFTPPAWTRATLDVVSLRRLDLKTGEVDELVRWPQSPLVGQTIRTYHGRIFTVLRAQLRVDDRGVAYRITLSIPRVPRSQSYRIQGSWPSSSSQDSGAHLGDGDWESGAATLSGYDETPLKGRWEAMVVPGPEGFPAAIVAYDEKSLEVRTLVKARSFSRTYEGGVPLELLESRSRRRAIERSDELERTRVELMERFRRDGLSEMEAGVRVVDEMRRLGFYPQPTTLLARELDPGETRVDNLPLFRVADAEMRSGVFPDIEAALDNVGTPVEKSMGRYVIHRDFQNSAALNEYLEGGGQTFYVAFGSAEYVMTVNRP